MLSVPRDEGIDPRLHRRCRSESGELFQEIRRGKGDGNIARLHVEIIAPGGNIQEETNV